MRKTRVRRRIRKTLATTRKTRKNIHKSKKHKNSRRYSRRRVMRGGKDGEKEPPPPPEEKLDTITDDTFSQLNVLNDGHYILIGYGNINVYRDIDSTHDDSIFPEYIRWRYKGNQQDIQNSFLLYEQNKKKYYYYNFRRKNLIEIKYKKNIKIKFYFNFVRGAAYITLPTELFSKYSTLGVFSYNQDYYDEIVAFFNSNCKEFILDKQFEINFIEQNSYSNFIIGIDSLIFENFHLPHPVTWDKTVYAYGFINYMSRINYQHREPIFIFKDESGGFYFNHLQPIYQMKQLSSQPRSKGNNYETFYTRYRELIPFIIDINPILKFDSDSIKKVDKGQNYIYLLFKDREDLYLKNSEKFHLTIYKKPYLDEEDLKNDLKDEEFIKDFNKAIIDGHKHKTCQIINDDFERYKSLHNNKDKFDPEANISRLMNKTINGKDFLCRNGRPVDAYGFNRVRKLIGTTTGSGGVIIYEKKVIYFNPNTILLGYGDNVKEKHTTFILCNPDENKFYFFNHETKNIQNITYSSEIIINTFVNLPHHRLNSTNTYTTNLYNEDYLKKITDLFKLYNIKYKQNIWSINSAFQQPINIKIENLNFYNFRIAHSETYNKNVIFAQFMGYVDYRDYKIDSDFLFIFQAIDEILFQNTKLPIEDDDIKYPDYNPIEQITDEEYIQYLKNLYASKITQKK